MNESLTAERLRQLLSYNADDGSFTRLVQVCGKVKVGEIAGFKTASGYISISVDNYDYMAHRLAWLHVHGSWPSKQIDHVNRNRSDNRLSNLRLATNSQNQHNRTAYKTNTSGYKGVSWHAPTGRWQARIMLNGKSTYLGVFETSEDAHKAYADSAACLHGEFARIA